MEQNLCTSTLCKRGVVNGACVQTRGPWVGAIAGIEVAAGPGAAPDAGTEADVEHADVRGLTRQMQAADIAAALSSSRAAAATDDAAAAVTDDAAAAVAAATRRSSQSRSILYRRGPGGMEEALHALRSGTSASSSQPPPPTAAPPLPSGRRIAIAVDGSDVSRRMVRWCCDNLLRPTDEVLLVYAVDLAEDTFRSMARIYLSIVFPPLSLLSDLIPPFIHFFAMVASFIHGGAFTFVFVR